MDRLDGYTDLESLIILRVSERTRSGGQFTKKELVENIGRREKVAANVVEQSIESLISKTTLILSEEFVPRNWGHKSKTVVLSTHFQEALPGIRRIPSPDSSELERPTPPILRKGGPEQKGRRARSIR